MSLSLSELLKKEIARKRKGEEPVQSESEREKVQKVDESGQEQGQEPIEDKSAMENATNTVEGTSTTHEDRSAVREEKISAVIALERASPLPSIAIEDITADSDKTQLAMKCNQGIHRILDDWEKRVGEYNPAGNSATLLHDTKRSLLPLLVLLRKNTLPSKLLTSLSSLLYHLQKHTREDQEAALQMYLKLSIGDVAWPIGVSDVGIHARSNHTRISKLGNNDVANIMRDERTRLWIVSVKRLISYEQWALASIMAAR